MTERAAVVGAVVGAEGEGMRGLHRLTQKKIDSIKQPGRYSDGGGLFLVVRARDGQLERRWMFRWKRGARDSATVREISLGPLRSVSIAQARQLAQEARALLAKGDDPKSLRSGVSGAQTFGKVADEYIASIAPGLRNEKHVAQWTMTLGDAYCRSIRSKPVDTITTEDILAVLQPVWQSRPETASRLRGRIKRVLDAAKVRGLRTGANPAAWDGHLKMLLPAPKKLSRGHHRAVAYADVPEIVARLRAMDTVRARALEWTILTAARTGEVIAATHAEIDRDTLTWSIPADRMKMRREHRVPLVPRCLEIIDELARQGSAWLFPSKWRSRHITNMAMLGLVQDMQLDATVHGMRACFKTWAEETTSYPREIIEAALAHLVGDAAERAYRRGDALERRRELMAAWGRYLAPAESNVVRLVR